MSDHTDLEVDMLSSDITAALAVEVASARRRDAAEHRRAREAVGSHRRWYDLLRHLAIRRVAAV